MVLAAELLDMRDVLDEKHHVLRLVHGKFHRAVFHLEIMILVREDVLALRAPDRFEDDIRPVVLDVRAMLRRVPEERFGLLARPLDATFRIDDENRLRQALHGVVHELIDIRDDALRVALEAHGAVAAALAREGREADPDDE